MLRLGTAWSVAVAVVTLTVAPGARAADAEECRRGLSPGHIACGGGDSSPGNATGGGDTSAVPEPAVPFIKRSLLRTLPDGTVCRYEAWVPRGEPVSVVDHPELLDVVFAPPCPDEADPVEATVREFWQTVVLPRPEPQIDPGRAITGKEAYLEIGGSRAQTFTVPNPLGGPAITVEATARYVVDWGDGTTTSTSSQGGPWPDGDVRHVWTTAGTYDVVVTEQWTATWAAGPVRGVLDGLETVGRIEDFPVQEVQAVRNR